MSNLIDRGYIVLVSFMVVVSFYFSAAADHPVNGIWGFSLLPFCYLVSLIIFRKTLKEAQKSLVVLVFVVVCFFRYVVVPFLFILSSKPLVDALLYAEVGGESVVWALLIMIAELLLANIAICLFSCRSKVKENRASFDFMGGSGKCFILLCFIMVCGALVTMEPQVLNAYRSVFAVGSDFYKKEGGFSTLPLMAMDFLMVVIPAVILKKLAILHNFTGKKRYYLVAFIVVAAFSCFFKGTSRFSVIGPLLAWIYVLVIFFPSYKRVTLKVMGGFALAVLIVLTVKKSFMVHGADLTVESLAIMGNAYFSNLYNMSYAVSMYQSGFPGWGPVYLLNDLIKNIAVVSWLADPAYSTSALFNNYIFGYDLRGDQIVPMTGQGLVHFSPLLPIALLWVSLSSVLMVYFSNKARSTPNLEFTFIYAYLGLFFSMSMMLSLGSIIPRVFNVAIPLLVLFWFNRKFVFSNRGGRS